MTVMLFLYYIFCRFIYLFSLSAFLHSNILQTNVPRRPKHSRNTYFAPYKTGFVFVNLLKHVFWQVYISSSSSSSSSLGSRCVPWLGEGLSMSSPNYPVLCYPLPCRVAPVFVQVVSPHIQYDIVYIYNMVFTIQYFQPGRPSLRPPCGRYRDEHHK